MLASAVGAGLLVGLALRGSLANLAAVEVRWMALLIAAVTARLIAMAPFADMRGIAHFLSLALIALFAASNLRLTGARLAMLGSGLNAAVVGINGGAMPVTPEAAGLIQAQATADSLHALSRDAAPFGDVLALPPLGVYSVGDVMLSVGVFLFTVSSMRTAK